MKDDEGRKEETSGARTAVVPEPAPRAKPPAANQDTGNHAAPGTLEEYLTSKRFAQRGWHRLIDTADYFARLVDGRTTGVFVTERRETYLRLHALATTLKAAVQWFALDDAPRPRFVVEAEKYLAEGPRDEWIRSSDTIEEGKRMSIPSGPVVPRTGGRGVAGRLHALADLKKQMVELLRPLGPEDLRLHQRALRSPEADKPKEGWILGRALAECILFPIMRGLCADLLREQGFQWPPWDEAHELLERRMEYMLDDADLGGELEPLRDARLDEFVEGLICGGLGALGARVDRELFRERKHR